jgi:hypothetical protein
MQRREKEERKLAQRRRGVKGRKRIGRSNQRNAIPKSPLLLLFAYRFLFSSLLRFCSAPMRLCARYLAPSREASFFQPVDAAADAVFHQRGTEADQAVLLLS